MTRSTGAAATALALMVISYAARAGAAVEGELDGYVVGAIGTQFDIAPRAGDVFMVPQLGAGVGLLDWSMGDPKGATLDVTLTLNSPLIAKDSYEIAIETSLRFLTSYGSIRVLGQGSFTRGASRYAIRGGAAWGWLFRWRTLTTTPEFVVIAGLDGNNRFGVSIGLRVSGEWWFTH